MTYGQFGGQYIPQQLIEKLNEIKKCFEDNIQDPDFIHEFHYYLKHYVGRPSPIYYCNNLTKRLQGAKIYLKREDLNHTGSHKINNAIGQVLLAQKMNKTHIIAETGAGQHGVAVATVCALFKMKCTIFMGEEDMRKQRVNVEKMKLLHAEVRPVTIGTKTLKEAVDVAFQYLLDHPETYYLIGSAVGPEPYPEMVKAFQKIIGEEAHKQLFELEQKLPAAIVAAVGGGSNAIGMFTDFIDKPVDLFGVEGSGLGIETGKHASAIAFDKIGVIHGMKTYAMLDEKNEATEAYSLSSGLDYPGIGPEHAQFHSIGRVKYDTITDQEALEAFQILTEEEGIIPALESSHALAYAIKIAKNYKSDDILLINLSGRGDKDMETVLLALKK